MTTPMGGAMTTPALSVQDVDVVYRLPKGEVHAVKNANLDLADAEILALLGSSGSGKSTLLRAIAGLEPVAAGRILLDGVDITNLPTHRRNIGMVFQRGELFPHRNVARNITYGLEVLKMPKEQQSARVEELLDLVGLSGYAGRDVLTLSGGQAQRVALARSLAPKPSLILLDEPLSALDRTLRERLSEDLREILKAAGTAAIYVTHDSEEARTVSDRIARIESGVLAG